MFIFFCIFNFLVGNFLIKYVIFQIILVDDASDRRYLAKELDDFVAKLNKVQILRTKIRNGLVGARLMGARSATGDVLVFLDAHCEVSSHTVISYAK